VSISVMTAVWAASQQAGTDLLMMLALADFSDDQGNSFPSVSTLASKCRMTARNANYILSRLQAAGELEIHLNQGWKGSNRYRIRLEGLKPIAGVKPASPLKPLSQTPEVGFPDPCNGLPQTPEAGCTRTVNEPSLTRQEPERGRGKRATHSRKSSLAGDFVISARVLEWAAEKGFDNLQAHFEAFVSKAKAKGYQYVDWDEAFMGAIRNDWAGLRKVAVAAPGRKGRQLQAFEDVDYSAGIGDGNG
jgi:hypothetical protein